METAILIAAVILGSITFHIINKHTIGTRDHMVRSWVFCTGGWFIALALLLNLAQVCDVIIKVRYQRHDLCPYCYKPIGIGNQVKNWFFKQYSCKNCGKKIDSRFILYQ